MKCLFLGDTVGKAGRDAIRIYLPEIKEKLQPDVIIANVENAAHGFGLTPKTYEAFKRFGVDVMTMGNHTFDKKDIFPLLEKEEKLIRPLNYPEGTIGRGFCIHTLSDGRKIGIVQVMGQIFMREISSPFKAMELFLSEYTLGKNLDAIIVDFHADATSEKVALGHFCDGKVSLIAGTHTHIPTADAQILSHGTGYITDAGMCGDYDSVIGMQIQTVMPRFTGEPRCRMEPAEEKPTLCGVFIETDDTTGLCQNIKPICLGYRLINRI